MAKTNKKAKSPAKKARKSPGKKKSQTGAKKRIKSPAKKKPLAVAKKKAKSNVRKKGINTIKRTQKPSRSKTEIRNKEIKAAPQMQPVPEEIKQEPMVASPVLPDNHDQVEEHKILEHQFTNREQVVMNQENQRVKSAMANRQSMKRVFRTPRHP